MSEVWGLPCKERWRRRSQAVWTIKFKALQCGERLAHCCQHLRVRVPSFKGHIEGDRTHTIGICETRDQALLYSGMPGPSVRFMIDDDREGWETSYRNRSSRSEHCDEEP